MSVRLASAVIAALALQAAACAPSDPMAGGGDAGTASAVPAGTTFTAQLSGAAEVPPNASTGTGMATATLNRGTMAMDYTVEYSGLTGPVVAAHIHGPAGPGENAPPVIPLTAGPSPLEGTATLTAAQVADLEAGRYYVNLHTAANPAGEVRGQLGAGQ